MSLLGYFLGHNVGSILIVSSEVKWLSRSIRLPVEVVFRRVWMDLRKVGIGIKVGVS